MPDKKITKLVVGAVQTNCWIYPLDEKEAAVIDPGAEGDLIISTLQKLNLTPRYILLTHGHFDHIAALPELAVLENKPQTAIHRLDCEYLGKNAYAVQSLSITAAMGDSSYVNVFWPAGKQLPEPDITLEEGSTAGPFTVLHLPGHTPGSIAFWDKAEGVLFSGDTLFNYAYGRTDLPGGSEKDIFSSLHRLFEMDGNIKVYPGHGSATTIELERRQTARLL
jgi:glyoxylase-like metal-dependent hydrolase (beta-lactamase superfamily II)